MEKKMEKSTITIESLLSQIDERVDLERRELLKIGVRIEYNYYKSLNHTEIKALRAAHEYIMRAIYPV